MGSLREDADRIIAQAIQMVLPDQAVEQALKGKTFAGGKLYVVAAGKAAWQMAKAACSLMGGRIEHGVVITKYDHVKGGGKFLAWTAMKQGIRYRMRIRLQVHRRRWIW